MQRIHNHDHKTLTEIHEDVPAEHYDNGIKKNLFQKFWHSRRFHEVRKVVKPVKGRALDVGCHAGKFTSEILPLLETKEIYGMDISPSAIKLAKKRIKHGQFLVADAESLPYKTNYFDAVFCLEMLEHVDSPKRVLAEIKRVLKKGGYFVALVPNETRLFKTIWFLWTMYYPVWRHAHVQSFKGKELDKALRDAGFKILQTKNFNMGMLKLVVVTKK